MLQSLHLGLHELLGALQVLKQELVEVVRLLQEIFGPVLGVLLYLEAQDPTQDFPLELARLIGERCP